MSKLKIILKTNADYVDVRRLIRSLKRSVGIADEYWCVDVMSGDAKLYNLPDGPVEKSPPEDVAER